jgi:hypothetical protein
MAAYKGFLDRIAGWIADRLEAPSSGYQPYTPSDQPTLLKCLRPGDILLVEGNQKISAGIKYLTQSTWSHAALYVGDALLDIGGGTSDSEQKRLIEVNLGDGCVAVPLAKYETYNTRICRASGLSSTEQQALVDFMIEHLGVQYDLRNIFDLARYLFPTPPVPVRWRRRMLSIGSGEPTRAICSTLIAKAFQSISYPILPEVTLAPGRTAAHSKYSRREILHIRHHSLFTPRDFDLSPYFSIIKPTIDKGFDHKKIVWGKPHFVEEVSSSEDLSEKTEKGTD